LRSEGPLFAYLSRVRAGDRATEFKQRCQQGISSHYWHRAGFCSLPGSFNIILDRMAAGSIALSSNNAIELGPARHGSLYCCSCCRASWLEEW